MRAEARIHEKDDGRQAGTEPVYAERAAALVSAKVLSAEVIGYEQAVHCLKSRGENMRRRGRRTTRAKQGRARSLGLVISTLCGVALAGVDATAQEATFAWNYNSFGVPGLIDMPTALGREDGELAVTLSHFPNQTRYALSFQVTPRLSAAFRYAYLRNIRSTPDPAGAVLPYIFDRSFSLQYQFLDEGTYRPALAVGINDLVGTGIYGGEYLVAAKTLTPRLRATLGLGWGRLGSHNGFSNPLRVLDDSFETRPGTYDGTGGKLISETWFRGDAAFFAGLEWQATDRLRIVAEYSSDDYARENGGAFDWKSPFNLGVDYRLSDRTTFSGRYLYGSEIGIQLNYALHPTRSRFGSGRDKAPPPVVRRVALSGAAAEHTGFEAQLTHALAQEGLSLEAVKLEGRILRIQIRNERYGVEAQAVGRAARVLTRTAPIEVDSFDIRLVAQGIPVTSVVIRRADMEDLEFHTVAPDLSRARTRIGDVTARLDPMAGVFPRFEWGLEPYLQPSLFDPDDPFRIDFGAALAARYEPAPGVIFSGRLHQKVLGNLDKGSRPSTSGLPHVRSDAYLYYQGGDTTIPELTAAYYFRPGPDLFGRVTVGYLESMFGGASAEILWKPQNSWLALGAEINHVKQRDFDQLFSFQDYSVTTGHISAYAEFADGYTAQLDVGRYLAKDLGATLTLAREFDNGWKVGAFATLTDVSAAEFGEGSFDKGIQLTIPLDWLSGKPDKRRLNTIIRPVQRDGGARLEVPGRLYDTVRSLQASELDASWGRFWR